MQNKVQHLDLKGVIVISEIEMSHKVFVVIPAFNEASVIGEVISEVILNGYKNIIVIDDGSADTTAIEARQYPVIVLRHRINRGKGAAVMTGLIAAERLGADVIVTIDGDGQHDPEDIASLVDPILSGHYDVVLGTRPMKKHEMPAIKVIANKIGNYITWLFYGIRVSDSQSGFRAYSRFAAHVIDTKADKYEYDSKVIREIKINRLKFIEKPIKVRYTEYSKNKAHKQGFFNGLVTLMRMLWGMVT